MENEKLTQCQRILRHLRDYGYITAHEAVTEYGIMRLAARIADLKKQGYAIKAMFATGQNRYGEKTSYAVYAMVGSEGK